MEGRTGNGKEAAISAVSSRLWLSALLVGTIFAALYFLTRTPALDEWDSVQFTWGVGDFNLWRHQPHPPGYPLYIAFGWVVSHLFGTEAATGLYLGSAVGGGLFVGCWLVLFSRYFRPLTAWLATLTLGGLLVVWMSATKVLTDPLGAGMLALALALLDGCRPDPAANLRRLAVAAVVAALAVGVRPQNFLVGLFIVALFIGLRQRNPRVWAAGVGAYLAGCLLWFVPMLWIQAHTPESGGSWWAYGTQLVNQWRWRLDQPKAYLGAKGQSGELIFDRVQRHLLDWISRGFGFSATKIWGWVGTGIVVLGWSFHVIVLRRPENAGAPARAFWRRHWPWALLYIATIFCLLPGDQRYYLPIYPLLALAAVAGWAEFAPGRWRWTAAFVPLAALTVTANYVRANHLVPAPPVEMVRYLQAQHPPADRPAVWFIARDDKRHIEWYAPDIHLVPADSLDPGRPWPGGWQKSLAIYTDDPAVAERDAPNGDRWQLVATFNRSKLIYRKHNGVQLYKLRRRATSALPPP